jgi:hypothetical protein
MNKIKLIVRRSPEGKWIAEKTDDGDRIEVSESFAQELADQDGVVVVDDATEVKMKSKALDSMTRAKYERVNKTAKPIRKAQDNDIEPLKKHDGEDIEPLPMSSPMQLKQFNYDNDPNSYPYEAPEVGHKQTVKIGKDGQPESETEESVVDGGSEFARKTIKFKHIKRAVGGK